MSTDDPAAENKRSYDLYLRVQGSSRLHWTIPDRGVILRDDRIAWTEGDNRQDAPLSSISTIRLETGGSGDNIVAMCQITFVDGYVVTVLNCGGNGLPDSGQAAIYREFAHDLHGRLVASKARVDYVAGYTQSRYQWGIVISVIAVLFFVGLPIVLLLITGETKAFFILVAGAFLVWPLMKLMQANAPHTYDPNDLPGELLL